MLEFIMSLPCFLSETRFIAFCVQQVEAADNSHSSHRSAVHLYSEKHKHVSGSLLVETYLGNWYAVAPPHTDYSQPQGLDWNHWSL